MRVLALASYPVEAAATRFRLHQFIKPLAAHGIQLEIRPFMNSELFQRLYTRKSVVSNAARLLKATLMRACQIPLAHKADVILVQREAMIFGPPWWEWIASRVLKRPMVLDLDDATYLSYASPTYGALGTILKWPGKTDRLIQWASLVTCGNTQLAEYVSHKGARAEILRTVVDTNIFCPVPAGTHKPPLVLGWIGTHSTFPFLEKVLPVLQSLVKEHSFRLKIVGAGTDVSVEGLDIESLSWSLEREVQDFQSIDIGLYPIDASVYSGWAQGKSGFKAVQYLAVGVPYVATPIGGSLEIGEEGETHFFASTDDEWYRALKVLITDEERRREMGRRGREYALQHYTLEAHAEILANALKEGFQSKRR